MKNKKKRLSQGLRKYIRRQKLIIKNTAKSKEEESRLIKELLSRFYVREIIDKKEVHKNGERDK